MFRHAIDCAVLSGIVHKGDALKRSGSDATGWNGVIYEGRKAYISAKYSKVTG